MPAVLQIHIGDQHANAVNPIDRDLDWLDGSVMQVWSEFRALLQAGENLCASFQHPSRGAALGIPHFVQLRTNWFAIRRRGNNTITPSSGALDDWWFKAETLTRGNPNGKRLLRANYLTFDPAQWGRHTDKARFLYITLDRDVTADEANAWVGKYTPAVTGDNPESEHVPRWIDYVTDLVILGHVQQRRRKTDDLTVGITNDVRDPGRIIDVAAGRPDTIVRVRRRQPNGTVDPDNRIDDSPVLRRRL